MEINLATNLYETKLSKIETKLVMNVVRIVHLPKKQKEREENEMKNKKTRGIFVRLDKMVSAVHMRSFYQSFLEKRDRTFFGFSFSISLSLTQTSSSSHTHTHTPFPRSIAFTISPSFSFLLHLLLLSWLLLKQD